jgi:hypothetical protein
MSMAQQFGGSARLPRPVQVWVLDALPGDARAGGGVDGVADHPRELIAALQRIPTPLASRAELIDRLTAEGFSLPIARWCAARGARRDAGSAPRGRSAAARRPQRGSGAAAPAAVAPPRAPASHPDPPPRPLAPGLSPPRPQRMTTNLRPAGPDGGLTWSFDLGGIADMYASYESSDLWPLLRSPPQGLRVDFVRATRSTFRWTGGAEGEISALGHRVHALDAGHWCGAGGLAGRRAGGVRAGPEAAAAAGSASWGLWGQGRLPAGPTAGRPQQADRP